jgi:uncharacterized protein
MKRIALAAAALLALAALAGVAARPEGAGAAESPTLDERTVTVSGTGAVRSTPDRAQISFGVESRGATARAALAANAAEMRNVIDALRSAGVGELATQGVSVWPSYGDENRVLGYTATNTVGGVVDADRAGAVIDAAVAAGANQIYGPSFTKSDADELYREALGLAVSDARARAETLATAAGGRLGRVLSVNESSAAPVPLMEKTAAADAGTPVVPGRLETTATVNVTFALT